MATIIYHTQTEAEAAQKAAPTLFLLAVTRKSMDKNKPLPESEKYRAILIPDFSAAVNAAVPQSEVAEAFRAAVTDALVQAGKDMLMPLVVADLTAKELADMHAEAFTLPGLVDKLTSTQSSAALNSEMIDAAYKGSATQTDAATRYGVTPQGIKQQNLLAEKFRSLASNNPNVDTALATKMLGFINEADTSNPVFAIIIKKLDRISKKQSEADAL